MIPLYCVRLCVLFCTENNNRGILVCLGVFLEEGVFLNFLRELTEYLSPNAGKWEHYRFCSG